MSNGLTTVQLNVGTGGALMGVDTDGTADYQVVKLGISAAGTTPVQVSAANPLPMSVTGANGTVNIVGTVPVSLSAANGTVNIQGTPPVSLSGANGTVNVVAFPANQAVTLAGANGTVNIVGTVPISLAGASGTVNVVGTVPILYAANSTFTLGTMALAGTPGVAVTGANGTVNIVNALLGTALIAYNNGGAAQTIAPGSPLPVNIISAAGTIAAAASPGTGLVTMSVYNTAAPAPTSGQSMALQSDWAGDLFVSPTRRSKVVGAALSVAGGGTGTLLAAQAAGIFSDMSALAITLSSAVAVGGTGPYQLAVTDGTTTYQYNLNIAAGAQSTPIVLSFNPPLPAGGAAAPWTVRGLNTIGTANFVANFVLQKQA